MWPIAGFEPAGAVYHSFLQDEWGPDASAHFELCMSYSYQRHSDLLCSTGLLQDTYIGFGSYIWFAEFTGDMQVSDCGWLLTYPDPHDS